MIIPKKAKKVASKFMILMLDKISFPLHIHTLYITVKLTSYHPQTRNHINIITRSEKKNKKP